MIGFTDDASAGSCDGPDEYTGGASLFGVDATVFPSWYAWLGPANEFDGPVDSDHGLSRTSSEIAFFDIIADERRVG